MIIIGTIGGLGVLISSASFHGGGSGPLIAENYTARVYLNGTIRETFDYKIAEDGEYRMLYRNWKTWPLMFGARGTSPFVEFVTMSSSSPEGTIQYVKDYSGTVHIILFSSKYASHIEDVHSFISEKALLSEAGVYLPVYFDAGTYRLDYVFRMHPPLECDNAYCHLNLMLADEHVPYRNVLISVHDPDSVISGFYTHPYMNAKKEGDDWVVRGASPENGLIEAEMLLKPDVAKLMDGFITPIYGVEQKTVAANQAVSTASTAIDVVSYALIALILLLPFIVLAVYNRYGKEKPYTVPKTLSYVPNPERKPWFVNLVFKSDPFDYDEDGFYATLLDFQLRGALKLEGTNEWLKITILKKDAGEDDYEKRVIEFLTKFAGKDNVFDTKEFERKIKSLSSGILVGSKYTATLDDIRETMDGLMKEPDPENKIAEEFVVRGKKYVWMIFCASLSILGACLLALLSYGKIYPAITFCLYLSIVLLIQSAPLLFTSTALFGRWKEDYYKEKLEWLAFRRFLSDFAMMKKSAPEDLNMWKEWLVYGTALGVGDKVAKAMEKLNVKMPEARMATSYMPTCFGSAYGAASPSSSGGGFGGGGGGGGGGR